MGVFIERPLRAQGTGQEQIQLKRSYVKADKVQVVQVLNLGLSRVEL